MATDDISTHTIDCPCKAGKIEVTVSSPDHPWVRAEQISRSFRFLCERCSAEYSFDDNRIVRSSDLAEYRKAKRASDEAFWAFMKKPELKEIEAEFIAYLEELPSVAAIYRHLSELGMGSYSLGTFRKKWGTDKASVAHVGTWNVAKVLTLLGRESDVFDNEIVEIKRLSAAIPNLKHVAIV